MAERRIMKELRDLQRDSDASLLHGIEVYEEDKSLWTGCIYPEHPPYNKAAFKIQIRFPKEYPFKYFKLTFLTPIYNPLVREDGRLLCPCFYGCSAWSPRLTVNTVVKKLLIVLYTDQADLRRPCGGLRPDLLHQYREQRAQYLERAEECTILHGGSKLNAAIFYSKTGRPGATEEADAMKASLSTVAVNAMNAEWTNAPDLQEHLHKGVQQLSSDCNLLFVCIMSHGRMGALVGPDDIMVPVDDLIDQMTKDIPKSMQLVILIQACQTFSSAGATGENTDAASKPIDANRGSAVGCMHIDLKRPNTVLLTATSTGGSAVRGEYTKALAAEISKADGKKHIYDMHTDAVAAMRKEMGMYLDEIEQVPQYRDTLNGKSIVIPKNSHKADLVKMHI